MYEHDYETLTQNFRPKHDYTTESHRPINVKELSTKELEEIVRGSFTPKESPRFSSHQSMSPHSRNQKSPPRDGSSKSFAGAMRSLQDKIRFLETENTDLKDRLVAAENKAQKDRDQWQVKIMEELKHASAKDKGMQSRLLDLEEELRKKMQRVLMLEEQLKIKDTQIRHCENEIKRNMDQFVIDKENSSLQQEYVQKQLVNKTNEEKKLKEYLDKAERERSLANEELAQEKRISSGLKSEVQYLRENNGAQRTNLQKNHELLEMELSKQNQEYLLKVKELEIKLRSAKELGTNQAQQIEYLKKEIAQLQLENRNAEDSRIEVLKSRTYDDSLTNPKKGVKRLQTNRTGKLGATIKTKSPTPYSSSKSLLVEPNKTLKRPTGTQKRSLNERSLSSLISVRSARDEDYQTDIEKVEQEIADVSSKYRRLLQVSQEATGDLGSLRKELNLLCLDMEKKNEELYEFKRKQQSFLKQKLI